MRAFLRHIKRGAEDVLFPNICLICGHSLSGGEHMVCIECLREEFEVLDHHDDKQQKVILPESVHFHYSLWRFGKGGYLQKLLHKLKYERLTGIAVDTGRMLGEQLKKHPLIMSNKDRERPLLIPVPLHPAKFKKRGYNQAFLITAGIREITDWEICPASAVIRTRNTRTQTGFDLNKRIRNISGAFEVREPGILQGRQCIIVDDVFTTGTTSFELSRAVFETSEVPCGIATLARA